MCLYLGMSLFCGIAAFTPEWRHVAVIWAVFFAFSLAVGRILSLIVDGLAEPASSISISRSSSASARWGLAVLRPRERGSASLGDDVGQQLILDAGDLVLEEQLLLLQPLQLQLIGAA